MRTRSMAGFTLLEMMITMLIVAILAGIALPGYQSMVRKSRRTDAMATLTGLQLRQEKWRASNPAYASNIADIGSPPASATGFYDFTIPSSAATTFVLQAAAKTAGAQNRDSQGGSSCATLAVNQSGERTPAECWR